MNLWTWLFALPLALIGVPPMVYAVASLLNLLYQFWIHTERVGSLGWFDRWFGSPSNHRVHHGTNLRYLDRNYGGILMIWDRIFGTFQAELIDDPVHYGTRAPVRSFNPLWINLHTPLQVVADALRLRRWPDRLRSLFHRPGWHPDSASTAAAMAAWKPAPSYDPKLPAALVRHGLLQTFLTWPLLVQLIAYAPALPWPSRLGFGLWLALSATALGLLLNAQPRWRLLGAWLEVGRLLLGMALAAAGLWFAPGPFGLALDLILVALFGTGLLHLLLAWPRPEPASAAQEG